MRQLEEFFLLSFMGLGILRHELPSVKGLGSW
jgi:hypothetical protein